MTDDRADADLFRELAMPLFASLYNLAHWLTQNREDAEDLVQETYVKALNGFASFQPGTNFRAWIYRILRNTFLTSRTGLKVTMTVPLDEEEDSYPAPHQETPESVVLAHADRDRLQQALEQLPVPQREIILLADVEEMSYAEIAEALSVPMGTVMSRLSRARRAMRDLLRENVRSTSQ